MEIRPNGNIFNNNHYINNYGVYEPYLRSMLQNACSHNFVVPPIPPGPPVNVNILPPPHQERPGDVCCSVCTWCVKLLS